MYFILKLKIIKESKKKVKKLIILLNCIFRIIWFYKILIC